MKRLVLVIGVLVAVCGVRAEVVAGWDVNGVDIDDGAGVVTNVAPYVLMATTNETGIASAKLELGSGVNPSTTTNTYGFKISGANQTNSLAGAISLNHYMEFVLSVESGYALSLDSIEMNGQASGTGCSNVVLMTSLDGFSAGQEIATAYPANATGGFDTDTSGFGGPIDLSGVPYQNLTGTVSFRLYGWNSSSGSGTTHLRDLTGDDLVVNGTIAELPSAGSPTLSLVSSNGTTTVSAAFDEANSTDYLLQHTLDLTASNGWSTVFAPFASNAIWQILTTNSAGFYRAIAD